MSKEELQIFRDLFRMEYNYVYLEQLDDRMLESYLTRDYVRKEKLSVQVALCYDWLLANQLVDVQE